MSGGHWDYVGTRIRTGLEDIANDPETQARWPLLGAALERLGDALYKVEHDLDWDLSGDTPIPDDPAHEEAALALLRKALEKP